MALRLFIMLMVAAAVLTGCQTTGANKLYSKDSITSEPRRVDYPTDLAFAIDLTIYHFPRRCVWWTASDGIKNSANQRPERFSFSQIISNKADDGWYMANVQPTDLVYNALTFFANGISGEYACGARHFARVAPGVSFASDKFHEVSAVLEAPTADREARPAEPATAGNGGSVSAGKDTRAIAMEWEGFDSLIAGVITLNQSKDGGDVLLTLPEGLGKCTGDYALTSKTEGTWSLRCSDGNTASGTFTAYGSGKGSSGVGQDARGRKVSYTIGGR